MSKAARNQFVDLFFRFQQMVQSLKALPSLRGLTPEHEALLTMIGAHWHAGEALSVRQAMRREELGSPATIHKRLQHLRSLGLIDLHTSERDSRKRMIVPTSEAIDYFAGQSKAIRAIAKQAN
ncbi:MAG: winged helix-turn-helix domain-containing protein [Betaproteobacteria bacterium]|nr:winged helix-turn-helix domain-containing protein [Betaproteobacteria bacterium]